MGELFIRSTDNGWIITWNQKQMVFINSADVWKFIRDGYLQGK